jgi:hypothetical protein
MHSGRDGAPFSATLYLGSPGTAVHESEMVGIWLTVQCRGQSQVRVRRMSRLGE